MSHERILNNRWTPQANQTCRIGARDDHFWYYTPGFLTMLPPVMVNRAGYTCWKSNAHWEWQKAPDFGVEYVVSGNAYFSQDGRSHIVQPGSVFLVGHGRSQKFSPGPAGYLHKRYLYLNGSILDTIIQSFDLGNHDVLFVNDRNWFPPLFKRIFNAMAIPGEPAEKTRTLTNCAFELLTELSDCARSGSLPPQVRTAMEFMNRNVTTPLTLAQIASHSGVSPQHLCRLFSTTSSHSPLQYFLQRRISYARTLLAETAMSIKEIAAQLGYDDPFYFSTQFRRVAGVSPREFRKQAWMKPETGK